MVGERRLRTEGAFVAEFIEAHCRITQGERQGEFVTLLPFQREILDALYELGADARRKHRQALIMLPRKNGKTKLLSCLTLYEGATGEPGGEIYYVAGDRQQASRALREAKDMIALDPELAAIFRAFRYYIEVPATGTILRVLSADAALQQGLSPSFVCFDEVAVQPNDDLWNAMTLGSGARTQPLTVGISTPGFSKDSLLGRLYDYGKRVEAGEVDDPTFFFRAWEPSDPDCDHRDPVVWRETNPALGHFLHEEDFRSTVKKTPEHDFRRFRLGQWTSTRSAALPYGAWEACVRRDRAIAKAKDPTASFTQPSGYNAGGIARGGRIVRRAGGPPQVQGDQVVLGFDGSWNRDSTGLVMCTSDGHLKVVDLWEQPVDEEFWRVNVDDVTATILETCRTYNVTEVAMDPFRWQQTMATLEGEGLRVTEFPTNSVKRMVPAWQSFYDAVMEKRLSHDGDPRLSRHMANLILKTDRMGARPTRDRSSPRSFIDLAIAAIIAYTRAAASSWPSVPLVPRIAS